MSEYIVLLDPSLRDDHKNASYNTGDCIIFKSVEKNLKEIFPGIPIKRISSHGWFGKKEKEIINNAKFAFVGGTNILTSDIRQAIRLVPVKENKLTFLFPGFSNVILFGTGWIDYEPAPNLYTRIYYQRILHHTYMHSIRDGYSVSQLKKTNLSNAINTSCPTTWDLDTNFINDFDPSNGKILFTLTDYNTNPVADTNFIRALYDSGLNDFIFFPQGSNDMNYFQSLDIYKKNKDKITLLNHSYASLEQFTASNRFNYAGTRLHAGIHCLKANNPVLIAGIDNRATEMGRDINLNVVDRNNISAVKAWIENKYRPPQLNLPVENIMKWKNQFIPD